MQVHHEYVTERLGTSELEIECLTSRSMLSDINDVYETTGGQLFHNIAEAVLGKHRFQYLSNRGVKKNIRPISHACTHKVDLLKSQECDKEAQTVLGHYMATEEKETERMSL